MQVDSVITALQETEDSFGWLIWSNNLISNAHATKGYDCIFYPPKLDTANTQLSGRLFRYRERIPVSWSGWNFESRV